LLKIDHLQIELSYNSGSAKSIDKKADE